MNRSGLVALLDAEIERLQQARRFLSDGNAGGVSRRKGATLASSTGRRGRRHMSAEARRRISEAQKKRWAARKRGAKARAA